MNFSFCYLTEPKEFAHASYFFIQTKPLLKILTYLVTIGVIFILGLLLIKYHKVGLVPQEWFMVSLTLFWLFARKAFNRWIFLKKFNKQAFSQQTLNLNFSANGITWSGEKFTKGHAAWAQMRYAIQLKNGFIFPILPTQFLFVPERVFHSPLEKQNFMALIQEQKLKIKPYLHWSC